LIALAVEANTEIKGATEVIYLARNNVILGLMANALNFVKASGIVHDSEYPYKAV